MIPSGLVPLLHLLVKICCLQCYIFSRMMNTGLLAVYGCLTSARAHFQYCMLAVFVEGVRIVVIPDCYFADW